MSSPISDPPNMGEIVRRLDHIVNQLGDITREIKEDRKAAAATYVRQDVYLAERRAESAVVADLHGDIQAVKAETSSEIASLKADAKAERGWRRQMWLAIGSTSVAALIAIIGMIINASR